MANRFLRFPLIVALIGTVSIASTSVGNEPVVKFLEALREQGYFDAAIDYLDRMKDSPLATAEVRESYLFERGTTLVAAAESQRDLGIREKQLDEAQASFKQFVTDNPNHLKVTAARLQLGNLLAKRASGKMLAIKRNEKDRPKLNQEARALFNEAFGVFTSIEGDIKQRLDKIPKTLDLKDKAQARKADERTQLREDYLFALLLAAAAREETAETVEPKSKEFNDLLTDAAKRYGQIYQAYRTRIAGLYALQYQGRCNFKIGKIKDAMGLYNDILEQPDNPEEFRTLKVKTMPMILACWMHESEKKFNEAIKRGEEWIEGARPNEERQLSWLEIRMLVARCYMAVANEAAAKNPKDAQVKVAQLKARNHAKFVAKYPSDFQKEAQQLVASLGGPDKSKEKAQVRTFAEAFEAGKELLDLIQQSELVVQQLPTRIANEKDDAAKKELEKQLEDAKGTLQTVPTDAIETFRLALTLADADIKTDDINVVRYFLCFLYYGKKDYYNAAVMGDFVARRHPDSSGARQSAKIALASYITLYTENQDADKRFETDSIISIADYITSKWAGHAEADEALGTLIAFMINSGNVAKAEEYLMKIPPDSPKRAEAELKIGQALWGAFLRGMQEIHGWEKNGVPPGTDVNAKKAALADNKARGQKILIDGVSRVQQSGSVTPSTPLAVLSLAQVYLDTDQTDKAVALIEDPKIGLVTLLTKKDPLATKEGVIEEAYRTVLRTYISALAKSSDQAAIIKKAQGTMASMKGDIGASADGQKKLLGIYLSLAKDLEQQLQLAPPDVKRALSTGFELFLNQAREESSEMSVQLWVADTYRGMAKELMQGNKLTPTAQRYYSEAKKTYEKMISLPQSEPQLKTHVRLQMAITLGELGEFTASTKLFGEILNENNSALNVQIDAAKMYQSGAMASPKNSKMYLLAISGDQLNPKTGKNTIWGWGRISQMTAQKPQFAEAFHEARYNLVFCRYQYALTLSDAGQKKKLLDLSEKDIEVTSKLFKDLGGPKWQPKYETLMRDVQKANGKPQTGIPKQTETAKAAA